MPHFEKMLYDQALIAGIYFDAWKVEKAEFLRDTGESVLDYVLREMRDSEGGFYSAEDADSLDPETGKKAEGVFYIWTGNQIREVLDPAAADIFMYFYGIQESGNVLNDPHGEFPGKNILAVKHDITATAEHFTLTAEEAGAILEQARERLLLERRKRPHPHLDDKIITSWNGLMISALAKGYQVSENPEYIDAAEKAARFILEYMYDGQSATLYRRSRSGEQGLRGQLDDYANFIQGLLDLYEAGFEIFWLQKAMELTRRMMELFEDTVLGGFFETSDNDTNLIMAMKDDFDGAEPAANSIAALNLLRLARLFDKTDWYKKVENTVHVFSEVLSHYPESMPQMVTAYLLAGQNPRHAIIATDKTVENHSFETALKEEFHPETAVIVINDKSSRQFFDEKLPFTREMNATDGKPTAYFCENYSCHLSTIDAEEFRKNL